LLQKHLAEKVRGAIRETKPLDHSTTDNSRAGHVGLPCRLVWHLVR